MIITISGCPGSGKTTVAKVVAKKLGMTHLSMGDMLRDVAESRGMSILEISRLAEKDPEMDRELDKRQIELASKDNLVVDSRLGFHFIPKSFKVFLYVSLNEAGRRIFSAKREMEKENTTLDSTIKSVRKRKASEKLRYKKLYGVNPFDRANYDLIIDTTSLPAEKVAETIIKKMTTMK